METNQKTALITGASSGLGEQFARLFAKDKINVILVARREEELNKLARDLGENYQVRAKVITKDLSLEESAHQLHDELMIEHEEINYLVNNAGFNSYGAFAETDLKKLMNMIHVNMATLTRLTRIFIDDMKMREEGRILNVASTAGFVPGPYSAVYYASKAYVVNLSMAIAHELKGSGVTMTVLCPGPTETEFFERAGMEKLRLNQSGVMKADEVARIGYNAMMQGKKLVIPGVRNKLLISSTRFVPRSVTAGITSWLMKEDK